MIKKDGNSTWSRKDTWIIILVLFIALIFRLYKVNTPLADLHSWRQADTAAVARNFANDGFNLLYPKYDDLSSIQSGKENPQGLRLVEFPLYNAIVAALYNAFGILPIEVYGRLVTIFSSLFVLGILYYFVLREFNRVAAIFTTLIYATFPFFVFFNRVVLPETTSLSFAFGSLFLAYLWTSEKTQWKAIVLITAASLLFSLSLLIKPMSIFFLISLAYLFWIKHSIRLLVKPETYLFLFMAFAPLVLWRWHISNLPEGVPAAGWLLTSVNTSEGLKNIFFRPAFFRWIFLERINNLILGGYLTFFVILGILVKNRGIFLYSLLISALAYLFVFQGGNVQHEYYQTFILPSLAVFTGIGLHFTISNQRFFINKVVSIPVIIFLVVLSFGFSYYQVKNYYNYSSDLVQIGKIVETVTQRNDLLVTDTMGDTTLLYLSKRKGAPAEYKTLPELKNLGYNYYLTMNKEKSQDLKTEGEFTTIFENDKFTLFKL